ncbi:uncharacterized protein cubi_01638 [Cryptosporidium ubiquitum]|uniref:SART-1 family protein n=1 Tax=Cryptosporidium ubiquitum TaxID=857276 RepID=A0A1J4MEM6_9CRYT|nr:uncharacterized protein cubi_01638 [Cryptosporidium ubiquitum]OII72688.1 hypothetical protein cubi_01638 [Cryptosporidium ubiquitum]
MSESDHVFDKFEYGKIITFEDKHILEYKDDEDDCDQLNVKIYPNKTNLESENKDNYDSGKNKNQDKFKFKRTKIEVIKKNLRNETNYESIYNEEKSNDNHYNELTKFNTNFLTNDDSIFDDTDIFYDRLKIQKKKKTSQNIKFEFESPSHSITSHSHLNNEENPSHKSNIYLSLETEFCRKIDNSNINHIKNDPINSNIITNIKNESTSSDFQDNIVNSSNRNNLLESQNNILKPRNSKDNTSNTLDESSATSELNNGTQQSNLSNSILYEEPLDFGISSALALLKKRGEISSSSKKGSAISNGNEKTKEYEGSSAEYDTNLESNNQVSIFHTDNNGNILNPKEAFKQLCWKFHGQKINRNKIEKMLRKHIRNKT